MTVYKNRNILIGDIAANVIYHIERDIFAAGDVAITEFRWRAHIQQQRLFGFGVNLMQTIYISTAKQIKKSHKIIPLQQ